MLIWQQVMSWVMCFALRLRHERTHPLISQSICLLSLPLWQPVEGHVKSDRRCMCTVTSFKAVTQCDILSPLRCHSAPTCLWNAPLRKPGPCQHAARPGLRLQDGGWCHACVHNKEHYGEVRCLWWITLNTHAFILLVHSVVGFVSVFRLGSHIRFGNRLQLLCC